VTVRAEEAQVLGPVVQPVSVDVVDVQGYRDLLRVETAVLTQVWTADLDERPAQHGRLDAKRARQSHDQHLLWRQPVTTWFSTGVCLPREMRCVDTEVADAPSDVCLHSAGLSQPQMTEHASEAGRGGNRIPELLCVDPRDAGSIFTPYGTFWTRSLR
jgi:hypothetical protein